MDTVREKGSTSRSGKYKQRKNNSSILRKHRESSEKEGDICNIPPRLFATNRYPPNGRINAYSKPEYLLDLVQCLEGTPEFVKLMESPFGCLFQLPMRKCSLSGKLVHNILSRGLVTEKEHELWFVFGGYPFRFSLREFAMVTGLPCGPFPSVTEITEMQTPPDGQNRYWDTLIGSKHATTVQEIVNMLKRDQRRPVDKKMPGWRRFRLALVVIVEGILICGSQPVRASLEVVEMVRNLKSFMAYPWGRESFELTIRMLKVGSRVENIEFLLDKFVQSHTLCHGFPLAIQLFIFRSIPLLEHYIPQEHMETFAETEQAKLTKLRSFHNNNILRTEFDTSVRVEMILQTTDPFDEAPLSWPSDVTDPTVDNLLRLIHQGHQFKIEEWHGGYTGCALMNPPAPKSVGRQLGISKREGKKVIQEKPDDDDDDDILYQIEVINYYHTMELQKMFESERANLKAELKREILEEMGLSGKVVCGFQGSPVDHEVSTGGHVGRTEEMLDQATINLVEKFPSVDDEPVQNSMICGGVDKSEVGVDKTTDHLVPTIQPDGPVDYVSASDKVDAVLVQLNETGVLNEKKEDSEEDNSGQEEEEADDDRKVCDVEKSGLPTDEDCTRKENDGEDVDEKGEQTDLTCAESDDEEETDSTNERDGQVTAEDGGKVVDASHRPETDIGDKEIANSKRGVKRSNESDNCNPDPPRPKRLRVLPNRFRSPILANKNTGNNPSAVYTPFGGVDGQIKKKFLGTIAASRNKEFVIDGHPVKKTFFKGLHTPQNWVDTTQMEAMLSLVWRKQGDSFLAARVAVLDTWFTHTLVCEFKAFKKQKRGNLFAWNSLLKNCVRGVLPSRATKMMWYRDVDVVYAPMNWGKGHWVALAIELEVGKIHILDPLIKANGVKKMNNAMTPIVEMLPQLITDILSPEGIDVTFPKTFEFERCVNVSQNERTGDCGPLAVKFIELDAQGYELDGITDAMVDKLRMKFAVDIYEEFVQSIRV